MVPAINAILTKRMERGGQPGNDNAARGRAFAGALRRVLYEAGTDREQLLEVAQALVDKAKAGDVPAIKELADRTDGRVPQAVEHSGADGGPIQAKVTVEFVGAVPGSVPLPVAAKG